MENRFIRADDVAQELSVSKPYAYKLIRQLNEELKEKNIGDDLGVSRTPVREALRQLELEGLVTIIPNKGAYVVGISKEDIQDIFTLTFQLYMKEQEE